MKRILLIGAGSNAGRNVISSLRMADEPVFIVGADTNAFHLACTDVDASYLLPATVDPGYVENLHAIIAAERVTFVHGQPDADVAILSDRRDDLPGLLMLPDHADIVAANDRLHATRLLDAAGVPAPSTRRLHDGADLDRLLDEVTGRDSRACLRPVTRNRSSRTVQVAEGDQVSGWLRYWEMQMGARSTEFMLCTHLPGRSFGFHGLWYEGKLITSSATERMEGLAAAGAAGRESTSGPSVIRTVHRDDINDTGVRAIQAISPRPHGVYSVGLREDIAGRPSVTDIVAGRFPAAIDFAAAAGSNLPWMYLRLAYGSPVPAVPRFNPVEDDLYWVRGVDRKPYLFKGAPWVHRRAA